MGKGACIPQEVHASVFISMLPYIFLRTRYLNRFDLIYQDRASAHGEKHQNKYQKVVCPINSWLGSLAHSDWIYYIPTLIFLLPGLGRGCRSGSRGNWSQATNYNIKKCNPGKSVSQPVILQITSRLTNLYLFWMLAGMGSEAWDHRRGLAFLSITTEWRTHILYAFMCCFSDNWNRKKTLILTVETGLFPNMGWLV